MRALLRELGDPQAGLRGALIAGTNGKGSTSAFLESILRADGLRTGLMPKPHLTSYTERIQLDATPISEDEFARAVGEIQPAVARVAERLAAPTEFEILTALAVAHLAPRVDRLVCEVGMGGRLDATNVLDLGVAVITNVALDHQQYLGATIAAIAREKAAIIKPGNKVVSGCARPARGIVEHRAQAEGAVVWQLGREFGYQASPAGWAGSRMTLTIGGYTYPELEVPLLGSYQPANAAVAVAAAHALGVHGDAVRAGVAATTWPGRLEVVSESPRVLLDGAHNPAALELVVRDVRSLARDGRLGVVFAAMGDKDLPAMLERLRALDPVAIAFTRAQSAGDRAADPRELLRGWAGAARGLAVDSAVGAVEKVRDAVGTEGVILVCGSLYLVGEVRERLLRPA